MQRYSPLIPCLSNEATQSFVKSAKINVSHLINAKGKNNPALIRQRASHPRLADCAQGLKNKLTWIKKCMTTYITTVNLWVALEKSYKNRRFAEASVALLCIALSWITMEWQRGFSDIISFQKTTRAVGLLDRGSSAKPTYCAAKVQGKYSNFSGGHHWGDAANIIRGPSCHTLYNPYQCFFILWIKIKCTLHSILKKMQLHFLQLLPK